MRKLAGGIVLAISVIVGIYLICFSGNSGQYSQYIVSREQFEDIMEKRAKNVVLLDALIFNEEPLFFDDVSNTFYYSLIEGDSGAYDPYVRIKGGNDDIKIAFLENGITEDGIKNNQTITFLAYTGKFYCEYSLKCTTLPLMNITYTEEMTEESVPMNITLFDNRRGASNRTLFSEGEIRIRGASTRAYPKKGYRISLTQESIGNNVRPNHVSLLGMRQDDDWLLYAAYNDQEKIRNVFSSNLWEYTCATDNALRMNTGMEYRYLELFLNGEYWGLYALGYPIDEKQLELDTASDKEALYKVIAWTCENTLPFTDAGDMGEYGIEVKGTVTNQDDWALLRKHCGNLQLNIEDNEKLYEGIDIDNAIDVYLFFNLIQGLDNISAESPGLIKNLYIAILDGQEGMTAIYIPWDMDVAWGNDWVAEFLAVNNIRPYYVPADFNCAMESGYLNQLLVNGDDDTWNRVFDKYRYLRKTGWSEENIMLLLDEYEEDIYGSGAYLRDMERWPEGTYADAAEGLNTFRAYVMRRLQETDLYYERLETVCRESIFIRRSAQYKDFLDGSFVIEVNDKDLLMDSDYIDLLAYMGVDIPSITQEVRFIIADPMTGKYDYLASLEEENGSRETAAGTLSFAEVREGVYSVYLNGCLCYDTTIFSKPAIRMALVKDGRAAFLNLEKGYDDTARTNTFTELALYLEALSVTDYHAMIEINNPAIWQDAGCVALFGGLGMTEETIHENTDFVVWNGLEKEAFVLEDFHISGSSCDTPIGTCSLYENEKGEYGVYLPDTECFVSSKEKNEDEGIDVRIVIFDSDSHEIVDDSVFTYQ